MKIDKNIPIPNSHCKGNGNSIYADTYAKMEFGDSVYFDDIKIAYKFANSFRQWILRTKKFPYAVYPKSMEGEGIYINYVKVRKLEKGGRVWLVDVIKENYSNRELYTFEEARELQRQKLIKRREEKNARHQVQNLTVWG